MGFRLNSLAMKYVTDVPPSGDYCKRSTFRDQAKDSRFINIRNADCDFSDSKKSPNDMSFRSNCNNVSIATLQYMERYQLLPNTDQRYGG